MSRLLVLCLLCLVGCAAPPVDPNLKQVQQIENSLGANITTSVDYIADADRTAVFLTVNNPSGQRMEVWMRLDNSTPWASVSHRKRIYQGNDRSLETSFRLKKPEPGVKEILVYEIFNYTGSKVMETEPIITLHKERLQ